MKIEEQKKALVDKWDNLNLYDCLMQELFAALEMIGTMQRSIIDLQNRVRHLEYMSCPIQKADEIKLNSKLNLQKEKP